MDTVTSSNRRRTQAVKTARVVVPPRDESTGLPDLPPSSGDKYQEIVRYGDVFGATTADLAEDDRA
jgi:hypothetical protein